MRKPLASSSDDFIEKTCSEIFTADEAYWNLMVLLLTTDVLIDVSDPKKGCDGINFAGVCCSVFCLFFFVSGFPYLESAKYNQPSEWLHTLLVMVRRTF